MAATSSRDSSAMKTLAFITTVFLPGTFVAVRSPLHSLQSPLLTFSSSQTIFSTGLFNWQAQAQTSSPRLLSPYFWIYWAFTIPLTLLVAFSWRMWWAWEKRHLDHDVLLEIENIENNVASLDSEEGKEKVGGKQELNSAWQALRRRPGRKEELETQS
jgi:hypothetical protein